MFIIGILSSPIPYILISFAYLTGLSYGLFSSQKNTNSGEEISSNIVNYEVLNPLVEYSDEDASFVSFNKSTSKVYDVNFNEALKIFFEKKQILKFIFDKPIFYCFLLYSNHSNRPPPTPCLN